MESTAASPENGPPNEDLVRECFAGEMEVVAVLLESGACPNAEFEGWSPLAAASLMGHSDIAKVLLEHGAKVNMQSTEGGAALVAACCGGHQELYEDALSAFAYRLSATGHLETINTLISHGADVNIQDGGPLWIASFTGHTKAVQVLIAHGAKVNMQDELGNSSLLISSIRGHTETVKLLLDQVGVKVNMQNNDGVSALFAASCNGHSETIKVLIAHGAEVNMQNNDGVSALMAASQSCNTEAVKVLLAHGAEVNLKDNVCGDFSLLILCSQGHFTDEVAHLLSDKFGVEVNIMQNNNGVYALSKGSGNSLIETMKILLAHGAEVNMQNNIGMSALMVASANGHTEIVKVLLERGAEVNTQVSNGNFFSSLKGHTEATKFLLDQFSAKMSGIQNTSGISALMVASMNGHTETVKVLLAHGAEVNMQDSNGDFPLMLSSSHGHTETAELLLDQVGIKVNMQNNIGFSALMGASYSGHTEIVKLVLHYDAHVDLLNNGANAQESLQDNNIDMSALSEESANRFSYTAQERCAEINMQNVMGQSALSLACLMGHTETVKLLLHYGAEVNVDPLILANSIFMLLENWEQMFLSNYKLLKCDNFMSFLSSAHGIEIEKTKALQQIFEKSDLKKIDTRPNADNIIEVIELLLEHGVDVKKGLIAASVAGLSNVFRLILESENKYSHSSIHSDIFLECLQTACFCGNTEIVRLILEHSAEACNAVQADGRHLLAAIVVQHEDATKWLLEDRWHDEMVSFFFQFMKFGNTGLLELLLNYGAEVNELYPNGQSPLITASATGRIGSVECLLKHGAKVNMQGIDGLSALVAAASNGHYETVKLLLDHNAEVNMTDNDGDSALIYAVYRLAGKKNSFPFLNQIQTCEHNHKYAEIVQILLSHGAKDNKNKKGLSAQIIASTYGITEVVETLIEYGGHIDYEAVEVAIKKENKAVLKLLLSNDQNAMLKYIEFCPELQSDPLQERVKKTARKPNIETSTVMEQIQIMQNKIDGLEARLKAYTREQFQEAVKLLMPLRDSCTISPQLPSKSLKLKNVLMELYPLASKWHNIGALLDLPPGQLDEIKSNCNEANDCLREMIKKWLGKKYPDPSWEQLVEVIEIIDNPKKAAEIRKKYCTHS